jgi:hypothetical protein
MVSARLLFNDKWVRVQLSVPIANAIDWRLIENRAMLLLDVGFVQTDLWNGSAPQGDYQCGRIEQRELICSKGKFLGLLKEAAQLRSQYVDQFLCLKGRP